MSWTVRGSISGGGARFFAPIQIALGLSHPYRIISVSIRRKAVLFCFVATNFMIATIFKD
jgi:hypothetical protein